MIQIWRTLWNHLQRFSLSWKWANRFESFENPILLLSFSASPCKPRSWLISHVSIALFSAAYWEYIKEVAFSNVPCVININWVRIKSRQMRMSNRNVFALNFLKVWVSKSYLGLRLEIPLANCKNTIMISNHKNYNFLACDWFKNVLFSTNSLAKLLSDSLLLDSLLLDSLLSDNLISQSHSKM